MNKLHKNLFKNLVILCIATIVVLPNIAKAGKYRTKGWVYGGFTDIAFGFPPYVAFRGLSGAIGLPPPYGLGVGIAGMETFGWFASGASGGELDNMVRGFLPIYIYFIPYAKWGEKHYTRSIVYSFLSMNFWLASNFYSDYDGGSFLKFGVGYAWSVPASRGFEVGFYSYRLGDYLDPKASIYLSVNAAIGSWFSLGAEEIQSPLIVVVASFIDTDGNQILSGNEEGKLQISISNKGKGKAKDVRLEISVLEKDFIDKITFKNFVPLGDIESYGSRKVDIPLNAQVELPKGKFTVRITCLYTAETGENGVETKELTINTAPTSSAIRRILLKSILRGYAL